MSAHRGAVAPGKVLEFLRTVGRLKRTKRTGWVHRGVEDPESVADHMYRMAMCSFLCDSEEYDRNRVIKLAVVHDLAESLVGDIAPHQNVPKEEKARLEMEAMTQITSSLENEEIAAEILDLFMDYELKRTKEAQLVSDLDKFEMIVQADDYEREQTMELQEFFDSTEGKFQTDLVGSWDAELRKQRGERRSGTSNS